MAKVTLSKARNIIAVLQNEYNQSSHYNAVRLRRTDNNNDTYYLYDDLSQAASAGNAEFLELIHKNQQSLELLFSLRRKLEIANHQYSISEVLNHEAHLKARIGNMKRLIRTVGEPKFEPGSNKFSMGLGPVTKEHLKRQLNGLELSLRSLTDKRAKINASEVITLSKEEEAQLISQGLLEVESK